MSRQGSANTPPQFEPWDQTTSVADPSVNCLK